MSVSQLSVLFPAKRDSSDTINDDKYSSDKEVEQLNKSSKPFQVEKEVVRLDNICCLSFCSVKVIWFEVYWRPDIPDILKSWFCLIYWVEDGNEHRKHRSTATDKV